MTKNKNPYVNYSREDIALMESNYFTLQFGDNFMSEKGSYLFTKQEINKLYNRTLKRLVEVVNNGSTKDRKNAIRLIGELIARPIRFH